MAAPADISTPVRRAADRPLHPLTLACLVVALAVALALRVRESLGTPLWFGELYILSVVRQPFADMLGTVARDIHPPLSFLLRGAWVRLGGDGEQWLRSLSILVALLSMVWTFRLGRRLFGAGPALAAVLLVAVNVTHARCSEEVENFSTAWLTVLGVVDAAWSWIERGRRGDAVRYVLWGIAAVYTHYIALFVLATLLPWGLAALGRERGRWAPWIGLHALVLLAFLPQGAVFLEQFRREGSGAFFHFPSLAALWDLWRRMALGAVYLVPPLLALSLLPLFSPGRRRAAGMLWALCTLPLLATRVWVIILPRDVLFMLPLWLLLVAAGLEMLPGRWIGPTVVGALFLFGLRASLRHDPFPEAAGLERALELVRARGGAVDPVIHAESHSLLFFRYHLPQARSRLLLEPGRTVHYSEGGLAVPESLFVSTARWAAERASGARWWGVRVNHATVIRGGITRAGEAGDSLLRAVCDSSWSFPPVTLYEGH